MCGVWWQDGIGLDIFALNKVRKKVGNASQIALYVPEIVYSCTKWESRKLNLSRVKIARSDEKFQLI